MAKAEKKERSVVVTTEYRGVFVGSTTDPDTAEQITLTGARMVIYWSADVHGVLGLAAKGATLGCRLSPMVDRIVLRNIAAIIEAMPEAAKSWEAEPWSGG